MIPQKDGSSVIIPLLEPDTAKETLGVFTNTTGTSEDHDKKIKKIGIGWVSKLRSNKFVKPADGWLSLYIQLKPTLKWGLVCICNPPEELTTTIGLVQHAALSHLRVIQKIYKASRTLPSMFGGLEMFDLNADCLIKKVYFMRRHWKCQQAIGQMMRQAFESFYNDVGLDGKILTRKCQLLGKLTERSWF